LIPLLEANKIMEQDAKKKTEDKVQTFFALILTIFYANNHP